MILYASSLIITLLVSIILGGYILLRDKRNIVNRLFFFKSFVLACYMFDALMFQLAGTDTAAMIWYKLLLFNMIVIVKTFLRSYVVMTKAGRNASRVCNVIHLLGYLLILMIFLIRDPFHTRFVRVHGFRFIQEPNNTLFFFLFMLYLAVASFMLFFLIHHWGRNSSLKKEKHHARLINTSLILAFFLSVFLDVVVNSFYSLPNLSPLTFFLYFISVYYSMNRYHFLRYEIKDSLDEILQNIHDFVIFIDPQGKIQKINDALVKRLGPTAGDPLGRDFSEIADVSEYGEVYQRLFSGQQERVSLQLAYRCAKGKCLTNSYLSDIRDRFGDLVGVLVISRENLGIRHFQEQYELSSRQLEIMLLSVRGLSNAEISDKLSISRRTVETHLHTLYSKLKINNKIELMMVAQKFDILALSE